MPAIEMKQTKSVASCAIYSNTSSSLLKPVMSEMRHMHADDILIECSPDQMQ